MDLDSIVIERRYSGPPNSANGGYVCGRIAAHLRSAAEVTLKAPPPLDKPLPLRAGADGAVALFDGEREIASGKPASVSIAPLDVPTVAEATAAAQRTFPAERHPLPTCFVCGPQRALGDGLRIHVGPVDAEDVDWLGNVAAPWIPDASLADADGLLRAEFVWAALDCPTAYAVSSGAGMRTILLGRQTVSIRQRPRAEQPTVVVARATGREGRKFFADATLADAEGEVLAVCRAIWIEVQRDVQLGQPA